MYRNEKDIRELLDENFQRTEGNYCIIVDVNPDNPTHGNLIKVFQSKQQLEDYINEWNEKVKNNEIPKDFRPQLILGKDEPIGLIALKSYDIKKDSLMSEIGKEKIKETMIKIMTSEFTNNVNTSNNP